MEKVKLMCSYGGRIQHRHHDRQLSYVGGDTKILTVDRNINFSTLLSKLNALCEYNSEIRLRYKLPGQDLDALISLFDDDDVDNMMFEYDLLRRSSPTPQRLRLFVFFSVGPPTPVTARSENPDFLFGFDKEYSMNYAAPVINQNGETDAVVSPMENVNGVVPVQIQEIPAEIAFNNSAFNSALTRGSYIYTAPVMNQNGETDAVVSPTENVNGGVPVQIQEIPAEIAFNSAVTRGSYVYTAPLVYNAPSGYFQAGQHKGGGNREQPVVYGYVASGNREQPVVYGFVPVMPSVGAHSQEQGNIPMSGSPLSYDGGARGEFQLPMAMMANNSNHDSKVAPGPQQQQQQQQHDA